MMDSNLHSAIESELAVYLRGHNQRAGDDMGAEEARGLFLEATHPWQYPATRGRL